MRTGHNASTRSSDKAVSQSFQCNLLHLYCPYIVYAMRPSARTGIPAISQNQYQTPDKQNTSTSKRKSGSPIPSANTTRSWKRNNFPLDLRAQPTLTQIDFVSKTQDAEPDDDDLDYIGRHDGQDDIWVMNEANQGEEDENGPDYRPRPRPRLRRERSTRFEQGMKTTMPNRKNMPPSQRDKSMEREQLGVRKSGETGKISNSGVKGKKKPRDTERKERNKTLTQMDFVQRWVKLESDDDTALDYVYYTPKNGRKSHEGTHVEDLHQDGSSGSKRRKLNEDPDSKDVKVLDNVPLEKKPQGPVTPQKPRKFEIPCSQSPESPGFAIISSSQFRSATRSPLKHVSANVPRAVQEESPGSKQERKASQNSQYASDAGSTISRSSIMLNSQSIPQPALNETGWDNDSTPKPRGELPTFKEGAAGGGPVKSSAKSDRTVVYETDGETDSGDFQDDLPSDPVSPRKQEADDHEQNNENQDSHNDDSQELPPIPPNSGTESGLPQSDPPMSSYASVCYRRMENPTQFPLEPIPKLNTQKMAELFPQDSAQSEMAISTQTQSSPPAKHPSLHAQRTQTQTQDMDNMSAEVVPESSPVAQREDEQKPNTEEPRRKSVVQVESSQPADRFNKQSGDSYPPGIISRSDLLSSSIMESIPFPQFLTGSSQDSVGEPYSIPEG